MSIKREIWIYAVHIIMDAFMLIALVAGGLSTHGIVGYDPLLPRPLTEMFYILPACIIADIFLSALLLRHTSPSAKESSWLFLPDLLLFVPIIVRIPGWFRVCLADGLENTRVNSLAFGLSVSICILLFIAGRTKLCGMWGRKPGR